ncbi:hypothetical protein AAF712_004251 [Marasmius tenuissimus]|uniref:BHLH domain-containing protein n=1 Tax=Marasmius tenuissimus TaxID=585030 RepID=A0ABR3A3I8_9AGAR|nr:hypothetical protein PM082_003396 [Marasmius tenuissimus]
MSLHPPVSYSDFEFTFDPQLTSYFPNAPQVPPSGELFSEGETSDIFNFLDGFNSGVWDSDPTDPVYLGYNSPSSPVQQHTNAPYSNPHLKTVPEPSTSSRPKRATRRSSSSRNATSLHSPVSESSSRGFSQAPSNSSDSSVTPPPIPVANAASPDLASSPPADLSTSTKRGSRAKPLLSTPQKRLNHIMSEQKRRNAIRDGYAQLITLLAPAGSAPGVALGMPTRGRPKGSGSNGKGTNKGKSGVLFRAVEYCRWLEEGQDALRQEVVRLESAAGSKTAH